jgi:MFS transporter, PPP family, 3-phenylpropionic acid transporter
VTYWRLSSWYFFYFAFIGAFSPYFTLYLQFLGLSAWDIGLLMALMQLMRLLAPALWGWLADRRGAKVAIVRLSAAFSMVGFLVFFFTRELPGLLLGMALLAFFWSAALPLVEALTLGHLRGRTEEYGRIRLWGSVGFVASVAGVGYWLDFSPMPTLLAVCMGLLGGIFLCALVLPEARQPTSPAPTTPLRKQLLEPRVVALLAACLMMTAAHGPLYVFFSIHLVGHGYGKKAVGLLWSLGVVAEILVFLFMPRLMRSASLRSILGVSFALAVLRFLIIGWAVDSLTLLLLAQLMHGATFGAYHAAAVSALNRWFPAGHQGRVQAIYGSVSFGAGGIIGNLFSGYGWDAWGAAMTFTVGAGFAAVGLLLVWRGLAAPQQEAVT